MLRAGDIINIDVVDGGKRRFRLTDDIGRVVDGVCCGVHGGMGQVIGARELVGDSLSDAAMVVKVVNHDAVNRTARDYDRTPAEALRHYESALEKEAAFLAAVRATHSDPHAVNIVKIECRGRFREPRTHKIAPILVMERCDFTLANALKGDAESDPRLARVLKYVRSLPGALALARHGAAALNALACLPEGGVVTHRDFKPSNILWSEAGQYFLIADFGTVKNHHADGTRSLCLGTPDYRAPEIALAERQLEKDRFIDYAAADSYSLGVVLFECLTGRLPAYPYDPGGLSPACPFVLNDAEDQMLRQAVESLPTHIQGDDETIVAVNLAVDSFNRAILLKLVQDCLRRNPGDRPKAAEILARLTKRQAAAFYCSLPLNAADETVVVQPATAALRSKPIPIRSRRVRFDRAPFRRVQWIAVGFLVMTGVAAGVGWVATGGAMAPQTPVPVRFIAPAPGLAAEPARWSGGYKDPERPLCRGVNGLADGESALPIGEHLVFSARFGEEKSWRSPPWPTAVVIPEYGPVQAAGPNAGQCGKPLTSGGASWGCTITVAGSGRAALALLANGETSGNPQAMIEKITADIERGFPPGAGPRPVETVARALVAAASGGVWTTFKLGINSYSCRSL